MVDVIIAFSLQDLRGGDHVALNWDGSSALVIETSKFGTVIAGDHKVMLHGNLGTRTGGRIIAAFYQSRSLAELLHPELKE